MTSKQSLRNIWCKWIEKRKNANTTEKVIKDIQGIVSRYELENLCKRKREKKGWEWIMFIGALTSYLKLCPFLVDVGCQKSW